MAHITSLHIYPIKSCAGWTLDSATLGHAGLVSDGIGDREWMIVTPAGDFLTQREHPRMALIRSEVRMANGLKSLVGAAPGMPSQIGRAHV